MTRRTPIAHTSSHGNTHAGIGASDDIASRMSSRNHAQNAPGSLQGDAARVPAPSGLPTVQNAAEPDLVRSRGILAALATAPAASAVDDPEPTTSNLVDRFNRHVALVNLGTLPRMRLTWHIAAARGLHKLLADRAIEQDDAVAGDVALGAPHWLTFSDTQVVQHAK